MNNIDRTDWPSGPWDNEPDRQEWWYREYPCLIVRNQLGALCGYVGLPPGHPLYGKGYEDCPLLVHGGLTYSGRANEYIKHENVADAWWIGFDAGHYCDIVPVMSSIEDWLLALNPNLREMTAHPQQEYRTMEYMRKEIEELVDQLYP